MTSSTTDPANVSVSEPAPQEIPAARYSFLNHAFVRIPVLLALLSAAVIYEGRNMTAFSDYDVWYHLSTGTWILHNHTLPRIGLFSQYSDRTWLAYSWGFEIIAATLYKLLGLRALPVLLMGLNLALAAVLFWLSRGSIRNFWPAVLLSAAGQYAAPALNVRPSYISMILFSVLLGLLFKSRRSGSARPLYWLPVLFAFWANLHIQFVYGLFALCLLLGALVAEDVTKKFGLKWFEGNAAPLSTKIVAAITAGCFLVTLIAPYSYHLYGIVWRYAHSGATYTYIVEMHAMNFRLPQHYVRLLLLLMAFFALGYRRSRDLFPYALLATTAVMSFHTQRDSWFMVLPSIAIIANALFTKQAPPEEEEKERHAWKNELSITATLVTLLFVWTVFTFVPSERETLLARIGKSFPVRACDAIRDNHLDAPIFNPLNWGGFLTWYMPEYPVSIDGRTDLYSDEIIVRQFEVLDGDRNPMDEPTFRNAKTVLLEKYTPLAMEMRQSPWYKVIYSDDRAVVFARAQ